MRYGKCRDCGEDAPQDDEISYSGLCDFCAVALHLDEHRRSKTLCDDGEGCELWQKWQAGFSFGMTLDAFVEMVGRPE